MIRKRDLLNYIRDINNQLDLIITPRLMSNLDLTNTLFRIVIENSRKISVRFYADDNDSVLNSAISPLTRFSSRAVFKLENNKYLVEGSCPVAAQYISIGSIKNGEMFLAIFDYIPDINATMVTDVSF